MNVPFNYFPTFNENLNSLRHLLVGKMCLKKEQHVKMQM